VQRVDVPRVHVLEEQERLVKAMLVVQEIQIAEVHPFTHPAVVAVRAV
jgi:hypothetical protein